jgi:hypothetical protein
MAAPIQSMPFLPLDGKSLITYPPSVLVKVILSVDSTAVAAKPPAVLTAATATSFDNSKAASSFDFCHSQATVGFNHNYSRQVRPQLQPQLPALTAAKLPADSTKTKPSTSTAVIASQFNHSHNYSQRLQSHQTSTRPFVAPRAIKDSLASRGFQPALLIVSSFHCQPLASSVFVWNFPLLIVILLSLHHRSPVSLPEIKRPNLPADLLIARCANGFPNIQQDCHSLVLSSRASLYQ